MRVTEQEVHAWLDQWADAIRNGDFPAGRAMFSEEVVAFGTVAGAVSGIDALETEQWQRVWPKTSGFTFGPPLLLTLSDSMAVIAVEWRSEGSTGTAKYDRSGRATLVLRRVDDALLCAHSHFSMVPGTIALRTEQNESGLAEATRSSGMPTQSASLARL